jgi:hypothetical protein
MGGILIYNPWRLIERRLGSYDESDCAVARGINFPCGALCEVRCSHRSVKSGGRIRFVLLPHVHATAALTDVTFEGYQAPARLHAEDISLTSGDGNLLGLTWIFTPFNPLDTTDSGQYDDGFGSGTNGLFFANGVGDLDRFDQVVSTVVGDTYTLDFKFSNPASPNNAPSELIALETPIPEPPSAVLVVLATGGIGLVTRWRVSAAGRRPA